MPCSKIVPPVKQVDLLDDWPRAQFHDLGILAYEDLGASDVAARAAEPERAVLQ